jgi:hypothetical protein
VNDCGHVANDVEIEQIVHDGEGGGEDQERDVAEESMSL